MQCSERTKIDIFICLTLIKKLPKGKFKKKKKRERKAKNLYKRHKSLS